MYNSKITKISKDIVNISFEKTDTIDDCFKKFNDIMLKYNIKQYVKHIDKKTGSVSYTGDSYEWTICKTLFLDMLNSKLNIFMIFNNIEK